MALKDTKDVIAEYEEKFWQDPDIIEAKKWFKEAEIDQAIVLITETFSEYSTYIIKYQEKYKDEPDRIDMMLKGIIPKFEQTANISSMVVPNNQYIKNFIQEKKLELEKLL